MKLRALEILMVSGLAILCQREEYCIEDDLKRKDRCNTGLIKQKAKSINNDNLKNFMNEMSNHLSHTVFKTENDPDDLNNDSSKRVFDWFERSSFEKRDGKWELNYARHENDE